MACLNLLATANPRTKTPDLWGILTQAGSWLLGGGVLRSAGRCPEILISESLRPETGRAPNLPTKIIPIKIP